MFSDENGVPPLTTRARRPAHAAGYPWPGNIRELRNFCENAVVLRRGGSLTEYDLEPKFRGEAAAGARGRGRRRARRACRAGSLSVEENEKRLLREALIKARGNRHQGRDSWVSAAVPCTARSRSGPSWM